MDEDTAIINSNTRNEKIRNFFINNKNILITILTLVVILLISYFAFDEYKDKKKLIIFSFLVFLFIIAVSSSIIKSCFLKHIGVFLHFYNILIRS